VSSIWKIKWDERAKKDLKKIDTFFRKKIVQYVESRIAVLDNPRLLGKALIYNKFGLWRYRVENYRIICRINDHEIEVIILQVGHRKEIYDE
jgi:mRNA interferase RelE/StbE